LCTTSQIKEGAEERADRTKEGAEKAMEEKYTISLTNKIKIFTPLLLRNILALT